MLINYLERAVSLYYLNPWHALWRSLEATLLASWEFKSPILDVGCGDGLFAYLLWAKASHEFDEYKFYRSRFSVESFQFCRRVEAGFDLDKHAICQARMLGIYKTLVVADACRLPYPNDTFATVFSNSVMEHIPDLYAALSEIRRVLQPGGYFLITVPSERFGEFLVLTSLFRMLGLPKLVDRYAHWVNRKLLHFHTMSLQDWRQYFDRVGFHLVSHRYYLSERAERSWSIGWLFLNLGWGKWTIGAFARQVIYVLDKSDINFLKRALRTLWLKVLRQYELKHDLPLERQGGALFLIAQKKNGNSSNR